MGLGEHLHLHSEEMFHRTLHVLGVIWRIIKYVVNLTVGVVYKEMGKR